MCVCIYHTFIIAICPSSWDVPLSLPSSICTFLVGLVLTGDGPIQWILTCAGWFPSVTDWITSVCCCQVLDQRCTSALWSLFQLSGVCQFLAYLVLDVALCNICFTACVWQYILLQPQTLLDVSSQQIWCWLSWKCMQVMMNFSTEACFLYKFTFWDEEVDVLLLTTGLVYCSRYCLVLVGLKVLIQGVVS